MGRLVIPKTRFAAKDIRIQGTYACDGVLVTKGILTVRFDRIPCGEAPWLVDPDLLKRFGTPWRTLPKKPPLEPRLADLSRPHPSAPGDFIRGSSS